MNPKLFLSALLLLSFLFSCEHAAKEQKSMDTTLSNIETKESPLSDENEGKQQISAGSQTQVPGDTVYARLSPQPAPHIDWDKKIIKTGTLRVEVKDFKKYSESIHAVTRKFGGYIAQEQQNLTEEKSEAILSIKVPVEQFETIMNELPASDSKVLERKITSEDVTGAVIDTRSRLEAKKQVRLKYIDFLKASKNMEDVLKVQSEINDLQEEIEAASGRVDYLSHEAAYSTINLSFYQPIIGFVPTPDVTPSFSTRVSNAFKSGADFVADLFVALISIWPLWLITIGGIFIFKGRKSLKTNPQKL
ncbi:MAG: DUF4349 domain-containing protein [Ferruginibacter sp.]